MAEKRREEERIEILGELSGAATVVQPLAIKELSRKGAQVETSYPLHIDSLHEFRLALGAHTVVVKGRVAHCRINDVDQGGVVYRAGIEFVEPSPWAVEAITAFIESVKSGRQG